MELEKQLIGFKVKTICFSQRNLDEMLPFGKKTKYFQDD